MDYLANLIPKPQRITRRNTTPEEYKKFIEDRNNNMQSQKNKEQDFKNNNPNRYNMEPSPQSSSFTDDDDDWLDDDTFEKWETEDNEKDSKETFVTIDDDKENLIVMDSEEVVPDRPQTSDTASQTGSTAENYNVKRQSPRKDDAKVAKVTRKFENLRF